MHAVPLTSAQPVRGLNAFIPVKDTDWSDERHYSIANTPSAPRACSGRWVIQTRETSSASINVVFISSMELTQTWRPCVATRRFRADPVSQLSYEATKLRGIVIYAWLYQVPYGQASAAGANSEVCPTQELCAERAMQG